MAELSKVFNSQRPWNVLPDGQEEDGNMVSLELQEEAETYLKARGTLPHFKRTLTDPRYVWFLHSIINTTKIMIHFASLGFTTDIVGWNAKIEGCVGAEWNLPQEVDYFESIKATKRCFIKMVFIPKTNPDHPRFMRIFDLCPGQWIRMFGHKHHFKEYHVGLQIIGVEGTVDDMVQLTCIFLTGNKRWSASLTRVSIEDLGLTEDLVGI